MTRILAALCAVLLATTQASPAQSPYDPVIAVNGDVITAYELDQRIRFLRAVGTAGDLDAQARDGLIEDRLRAAAGRRAGIFVSEDAVQQDMENFVARGNITLDQFREILTSNGVEFDTFSGFARLRVTWREVIAARFGGRVQVTEDEVDRALTLTAGGGLRVLLSEIVLPADQTTADETRAFADELSRNIGSFAEFERAARRYSAAPSRDEGGHIDWIDLSRLPPNVSSVLLGLAPGEVSPPILLQQAVVLFQLRALSEAAVPRAGIATLDYMQVRLPANSAPEVAAGLAARSDTCIDLQANAGDLPGERVSRQALPPRSIPPYIRSELDLLDAGEVSTRLRTQPGGDILVLMLCARSPALPEGETREEVAQRLRGQRLEALADSYLSELRAAAVIERR